MDTLLPGRNPASPVTHLNTSPFGKNVGHYHQAWALRVYVEPLVRQGLQPHSIAAGMRQAATDVAIPWLVDQSIHASLEIHPTRKQDLSLYTDAFCWSISEQQDPADSVLLACRYAGHTMDLDDEEKDQALRRAFLSWNACAFMLYQFWHPLEEYAWKHQRKNTK